MRWFNAMSNPKLFISYSWSSPEHEAWVLKFAGELRSQGIDVILDKWDLKPGHDANAFMESMVTDETVTKVVLVCDKKYAEKSNNRAGGAGTEAQIITPQLYAKRAQDKFVAVIREKDEAGKAYLPVYYGSRIYIDLADEANYATEFERLVRWAWDKPVDVKPELGKIPSFLREEDNAIKLATSVPFRRAIEAIRNGRDNSVIATSDYLATVLSELDKFRISAVGKPEFDEIFVKNIDDFLPYRNELIELFIAVAKYNCDEPMLEELHRFFEGILPFFKRPENVGTYTDVDYDNFKFIGHELFLYCIGALVSRGRFDAAAYFVNNEYFVASSIGNRLNPMRTFVVFRNHLQTLELRNRRLGLNRSSLHADLLKTRSEATGIDFRHLMTADLFLYLRSHKEDQSRPWWPETLLYAAFDPITFEVFARAKSKAYFERIKPLLGVADKEEFVRRITQIYARPERIPKWSWDSLDVKELVQLDAIATT
ncbi:hypothetical protein GGR34_002801 [Microvirga flocculans]|uniref:SEFIR domain-containing protein n=1 Tax=Microvirga flocculans TaxID=217168 RepID=A0A7W6IGN7_9HYPH|nr:SEFIR domain-containing protein [Microvirga flocculans]MBB4041138.1 hypothetical protein [Microvirga flocculans]